MELRHELRRLCYEHAQLRELGDKLRSEIAAPMPVDFSHLQSIRGEYELLLVRHLKCEDWILYPRINASLDKELSHLADRVFAEYGDLADRLMSYMDQWTVAAMRAEWQAYCVDTLSLLDHMDRRSAMEETVLFPAVTHEYAIHRRVG